DWQTLMLFPKRRTDGASTPTHVLVRSDLAGVESRLPAPLAKSADTVRALELDIALPGQDELEVAGRFGDGLNAVLRFEAAEDRWSLERGAIHVGSAAALLPLEPGIEVSGRADFVRIDDWLELTGEGEAGWTDLYSSATLRIDRLAAFGQIFPDVGIDARREGDEWRLAAEGPNLAGTIRLPRSPDNDTPVEFDMQRLWLIEDDPGDVGESDPRSVVPVNVSADDFVLGKLHFGRLRADLRSTPSGVTIAPIDMQGESFAIEGDAAWLVHPNDESLQRSRMRLALNGTNIQAVLASFGYDPVIEGKAVTAAADLAWAGAPDSGFLYRAEGGFSVDMKNGAVLPLEPGGGRLLGVLSVTALPRRLALDFRDVTDEGLGFDTLHGDFTLDKGNVYTCNLGVEGSVADMGIVGRAGLESEDYDQLAVVRPHVSNLFALGGAVVAGPAAGAAMLLFSQIFRKPLSQLGESYYRVTGSWDNPEIVRLQGSDVDLTPLKNCETYVEDALTAAPD
ncbi:MAG: YhdP family protein, partial [Gammaproteobacteria bacterium]